MANLQLQQKHNLSSMRKLALGTWRTTYDPSVYGSMTIRMDAAMEAKTIGKQQNAHFF